MKTSRNSPYLQPSKFPYGQKTGIIPFMHSLKAPALLFFCLIGTLAMGQAARSPFSAYGYGDYNGDALVPNQGMAGAGVSLPQYWYINNLNPAMLVFNNYTVFQAGIVGDKRRQFNGSIRENTGGGNLSNLSLAFPAKRTKDGFGVLWGTAIGLMPYTTVGYKFQQEIIIPGSGGTEAISFEESKGGFTQFYWSNGVRITENFSLGLKTALLFSAIQTDYGNAVIDTAQTFPYLINVNENKSLRAFKFTPSFRLRLDSVGGSRYHLNLGGTWEIGTQPNLDVFQIFERQSASGAVIEADSLLDSSGKIVFPHRITVGASFGRPDKWMVAADFTFVKPQSKLLKLGIDEVNVQNGLLLAVGAELTPDVRSLGSYFKRVTYRTGISLENGTYLVSGNPIKDFGINFGLSFPVNRISSLDIAFRTGKRGDRQENGIEENYFKVYFGVTFNDYWFRKRKFD